MDISWGSIVLKFVLMVKYISSWKGYFCVLFVYLFIVLLFMHRALGSWVWLVLEFALCSWSEKEKGGFLLRVVGQVLRLGLRIYKDKEQLKRRRQKERRR